MTIDTNAVEIAAKQELRDEDFRRRVDKRKEEIRARRNLPWYKKLFPFKIKIERII